MGKVKLNRRGRRLLEDAQAEAERITGIRQVRFDKEMGCVLEKIPGLDVWVPSPDFPKTEPK